VYRAGFGVERGYPVGRWWRKKLGAIFKAYAKALNLLRLEWSCLDRDSLAEETGHINAPLLGSGAMELLDGFMVVARPALLELHRHAVAVLESSALPSELALKLLPLIVRMSGAATGGRNVERQGLEEAVTAYNSLILTGIYFARGLRLGTGLRATLDTLCGPYGPLVKRPSRCIYSVHPRYACAAHALAEAA
jgi:hypothetical protein